MDVKRLWPNREQESNWLMSLFCRFGFHDWRQLALANLVPGKDVRFCFWCSTVKINGVIYQD